RDLGIGDRARPASIGRTLYAARRLRVDTAQIDPPGLVVGRHAAAGPHRPKRSCDAHETDPGGTNEHGEPPTVESRTLCAEVVCPARTFFVPAFRAIAEVPRRSAALLLKGGDRGRSTRAIAPVGRCRTRSRYSCHVRLARWMALALGLVALAACGA